MAQNPEEHQEPQADPTPFEEGSKTQPLPYAQDPGYQALLTAYQNGDWAESERLVTDLLTRFPDDKNLLQFQNEIGVKAGLQHLADEQAAIERRESRIKLATRAALGTVILLVVGFIGYLALSAYQTRVAAIRAEQTAAALAITLETKSHNAEALLQAGREEEALDLYLEIQSLDPDFPGIDEKVAEASLLVQIEEQYQLGMQQQADGDLEQAHETFVELKTLAPFYRDVNQRILQIEDDIEIETLRARIPIAHSEGEWEEVVQAYARMKEIDPGVDHSDLDEYIFISFRNLIVETADQADVTLEEIDTAESYYRQALSIAPQSREFAGERAELQEVATRLIANRYYLFAVDLMVSGYYSEDSIKETLRILNLANSIGAGSPTITNEIERTQLFLDGFMALSDGRLDAAIEDLEALFRQNPNFAEGFVEYLLYEAYLARGDLFYTFSEFTNAQQDYEKAEVFARGDHGSLMQLFQIEIRIGYNLRRMTLLRESAEYYQYALELIDLSARAAALGETELAQDYQAARTAAAQGDHWNATRLFESVIGNIDKIYDAEAITVSRGASIFQLAFSNGSSVSAIRNVNNLGSLSTFRFDQEISIPVILEEGS